MKAGERQPFNIPSKGEQGDILPPLFFFPDRKLAAPRSSMNRDPVAKVKDLSPDACLHQIIQNLQVAEDMVKAASGCPDHHNLAAAGIHRRPCTNLRICKILLRAVRADLCLRVPGSIIIDKS